MKRTTQAERRIERFGQWSRSIMRYIETATKTYIPYRELVRSIWDDEKYNTVMGALEIVRTGNSYADTKGDGVLEHVIFNKPAPFHGFLFTVEATIPLPKDEFHLPSQVAADAIKIAIDRLCVRSTLEFLAPLSSGQMMAIFPHAEAGLRFIGADIGRPTLAGIPLMTELRRKMIRHAHTLMGAYTLMGLLDGNYEEKRSDKYDCNVVLYKGLSDNTFKFHHDNGETWALAL